MYPRLFQRTALQDVVPLCTTPRETVLRTPPRYAKAAEVSRQAYRQCLTAMWRAARIPLRVGYWGHPVLDSLDALDGRMLRDIGLERVDLPLDTILYPLVF